MSAPIVEQLAPFVGNWEYAPEEPLGAAERPPQLTSLSYELRVSGDGLHVGLSWVDGRGSGTRSYVAVPAAPTPPPTRPHELLEVLGPDRLRIRALSGVVEVASVTWNLASDAGSARLVSPTSMGYAVVIHVRRIRL